MNRSKYKYHLNSRVNSLIFILLALMIIAMFVLNLLLGSVSIPVLQVVRTLFGMEVKDLSFVTIILQSRLPMAITAMLAGAALGVAGLMMQTLFRNPLAGPSVLGVSSGASLGVALVMLFIAIPGGSFVAVSQISGKYSVIIAAFVGSSIVLFIISLLASRFNSNTIILIIGIMIAYATSSLVGILQFYSLKEDLQAFVIWGLGSFGNVPLSLITTFALLTAIGLTLSVLLIKPLNLFLLGEYYAINLGLNTKKSRYWILITTGLLTATVTAFCGPIAFLGLAVPHIARIIFQTSDHRIILPGSLLCGALLALVCNIIARLPGIDSALPINAITSLIGAPIVIWLLVKKNTMKIVD